MGKGKKRKSTVDTEIVTRLLGEELREEQLRDNPVRLENDELFVEDTQPDNAQIHLGPRKRHRASKEKRLTRAQAIITACKPLPFSKSTVCRKKRGTGRELSIIPTTKKARSLEDAATEVQKDIWVSSTAPTDWVDVPVTASRPKSTDKKNRPNIRAVEVDPAGCSYNPDMELHVQAVAEAVGHEYLALIDKELQPKAPPATVTQADLDMKEMSIGLLDGDAESDPLEELDDSGHSMVSKPLQKHRTKKDRARQLRHKQAQAENESKRVLKCLRRQLENLKDLEKSIDADQADQERAAARKKLDAAEKEATEPPKLSKHKYKPMTRQVLSSDNVCGSLRRLKTIPVVMKDRFKSYQKRGIIQVTVKQHWNKPTSRRVKTFERSGTKEVQAKRHKAIQKLRKARKGTQGSEP